MVILTLAGCKTKAPLPTTTIFTNAGERELPLVTMLVDFAALIEGNDIRSFLNTVPGSDQEFHVEIEVLPNTA